MEIVIITNCSKRKKQQAQQSLMAINLKEGSIEQVSNEWLQKVKTSNGSGLLVRDQYVGRSLKEVKKIEKTQEGLEADARRRALGPSPRAAGRLRRARAAADQRPGLNGAARGGGRRAPRPDSPNPGEA